MNGEGGTILYYSLTIEQINRMNPLAKFAYKIVAWERGMVTTRDGEGESVDF